MDKIFKCSDMDPDHADCTFMTSGEEDVVIEKAKQHLSDVHAIEEEDLTPEIEEKIMGAMKDEDEMGVDEEENL